MPTKAKYTEEQYEAIHKDLAGVKDSNEADEVFVKHAELLKAEKGWTSLKNGYWAKARHKRTKGDSSYLQQYEKLYPGKVDTLATQLQTFNKNQILEWIDEFITYPIPNMEFVKESVAGGQNDKFFHGILATFLMKDIEKYDEIWHKHREFIHQYLQDRIFDVKMSLFFYPMSAFILYGTFTLPFELQAYKIALTFFALIMAVLPITHYFKTIRTFKEAQRIETGLIERTNNQIMKKYPKELLDSIWNTHQLDTIKRTSKNEEHLELAEQVYSGAVDFTENGLMDFAIHELTEIGWFASKFGDNTLKLWRPPHAMSKAYRHFYNKAQCNFVDVEAYYRIAERDGWE